ncbi:something about silencing, SAS, complex subunit 4-domain-containing protein [Chaetomium strumarium]|uniref:Something about silencing, SAS, complex subunit 4-domain-containing protein n=1 Tax=Chaetomium strumarium TaxID=1170767 RepID=A0AAJ0M677_9PEZI|nr:something about silencing, SAS, complex subunit 4-domain-containing protein [Chaetomium strumarium]
MAMAGTVTRSRRADTSQVSHSSIVNARRLLVNAKDQAFHITGSSPPRKRPAPQRDLDNIVNKKARFTTGIAVEIPARPPFHTRLSREPTDAKPAPPPPTPKPAAAAPNPPTTRRAAPLANDDGPPKTTSTSARQRPTRTKHQEKVANGLKHELSRLQPNAEDTTKHEGRKLRSQEVTRFKSELSAYFPEYDEVIGNDPKETHLLNLDTPIVITDEAPPPHQHNLHHHRPHPPETYPIRSYSDALYTDLFEAQRIDFSFLNQNTNTKKHQHQHHHNHPSANHVPPSSDPLPDTLYTSAHRKAERLERSIRNTEKGRAQHERDQVIRLLDGLQGPDWLRVMGVSGVTESRKRAFEPAREHFIKGCEGILEKFRRWAAEEKRMRLERLQKREEEGNSVGEGSSRHDGEEEEDDVVVGGSEAEHDGSGDDGEEEEEGEPPDDDGDDHDSDVDAEIAKQLREEALAAATKGKGRRKKMGAPSRRGVASRRAGSVAPPPPSRRAPPPKSSAPPEEPPKEFTSFFAKRYQREAALSKTRRTGRKVLAWGHPIPDMPEREFELPAELRDEDTLRSRARTKRRDKRVRK